MIPTKIFRNGTSRNDTLEEELVCDIKTEESCWDDMKVISCSLISDGGCPCPKGLVQCNTGFCEEVCCDSDNEYTCYEGGQNEYISYNKGGQTNTVEFNSTKDFCGTIEDGCACPEGQQECGKLSGFCSNVCCDRGSEEHCYGPDNTSYCAKIADGGCPCPKGQERCRADLKNNILGECTDVCCNQQTEEACYDYDDFGAIINATCALIADGGCPCPENQVRCGQGMGKLLLLN